MEQRIDKEILLKLKQKRRRKLWSRIVSMMMCVVVFCTTYALILPAITKEAQTFCGMEEHSHTDACFTQVMLCENHAHTEACFEQHSELICALEETEGHTHTEACSLQTETVLICGLEESEGHTHAAECAVTQQVLSCGLEETPGHTHAESCISKALTCSLPEDASHTHDDNCYTAEYICGLEESAGHAHADACYITETTYVCGLEETAGHQHDDTCWTEVTTYSCGQQEAEAHAHTEACYNTTQVQICTIETDPEHAHTESCYETRQICQLEEHTHSLICYSDPTADLETATNWEATLPDHLTGSHAENILAVAKSQLGYAESTRNYIVVNDEAKGYTRYGAWYGVPYGDWCAMYVSFCLHYAGVEEFPLDSNCPNWIEALTEQNKFLDLEDYIPSPGDIIFFDWNDNDSSDHVGIVAEYLPAEDDEPAMVRTIEGNSGNRVQYKLYSADDPQICGYGVLSPVQGNILPTLIATIYTDGTYQTLAQDDTVIAVTGDLPANAEVRAFPSQIESDALNTLCVYDIEIFLEDGSVYVHEGDPLSVNFSSPQIDEICSNLLEPEVYYIPETGEPEPMDTVVEDGNVTFETPHFSTYALVLPDNVTKVSNQDQLVAAWNTLSGGRQGAIQLTADFSVNTVLTLNNANANITLDLNGHTLTHTGSQNLFQVQNGTLTVGDSAAATETVENLGIVSVNDLGAHVATTQEQDNKVILTYHITESEVIDADTGDTQETLYKHTVTGAGTVLANASAPVFRVTGGTLNIDSGMYYGGTERAINQSGGTVNLNGGYACGFTDADYGGSVYSNGGTLNLSGTVIAANEADRGGAVYAENTEVNITGGVVSGNIATHTGGSGESAAHYGGGGFYLNNSTAVMSGGYVTNNLARAQGYFDGGGGFLVCGGTGKISVSGGYITGNQAYSGGGIRTNWKNSVELTVSNGYVCANLATDAEGGGISLNMGGTGLVTGGYINNNATNADQHWGGGGLFGATGSNLYIRNVLITDNSAGGFGGGVGGCSTGRVYICVREGGAVYDNTAQGVNMSGDASVKSEDRVYAHNSEVFMNNGYQDYFCALNSIVEGGMLGGYAANWTGSADGAVVRATRDDTLVAAYVMGLNSAPTQQAKDAAIEEAKVYINGNTSYTHGGGILCNGYMIIGETDHIEAGARIELQASKEFLGSDTATLEMLEGQFTFHVIDAQTGAVLSVASNDAEGNINFKERLPFFSEGTFVYYIKEVPNNDSSIVFDSTVYRLTVDVTSNTTTFDEILVNGDTVTIQRTQYLLDTLTVHKRNGDDEWILVSRNENPSNNDAGAIHLQLTSDTTFTNVKRENIDIEVQKRWDDDNAATRPASVTVSLNRNGTSIEKIKLSSSNNWYHKWSDLPTISEDGTAYVYTVTEDPVPGYVPEFETITNNVMTGYWIPATSVEVGERYAIISPDHQYALYMNDDKVNSPLTTNEKIAITTTSVTIGDTTYPYAIEDGVLDDRSIFRAETNGAHSNTRTVLRNLGINGNSWLLSESNGGTYLKGCNSQDYASGFAYNNGIYIQRQWDKNNEWRYLVFRDNKFNTEATSSNNNALLYRYVYTGDITSNTLVRITNRSTGVVTYTLDITKISGINNDIRLAGAEFQLLDPNTKTPLSFVITAPGAYVMAVDSAADAVQTLVTDSEGKLVLRGLNAGDYVLRETKAPADHLPIADMTVTLGETDESGHISLTLPLTIVDSAFTYELPETGGTGTYMYTTAGLLLMLTSAAYLVYNSKKRRKEVT